MSIRTVGTYIFCGTCDVATRDDKPCCLVSRKTITYDLPAKNNENDNKSAFCSGNCICVLVNTLNSGKSMYLVLEH